MADLMDLLQSQVSQVLIENVTKHLGGSEPKQTETAAAGIFTLLTDALSRNASTPEGEKSILSALDRDHDGSILDDLGGFLTGDDINVSSRTADGIGILGHILGSKQNRAIEMISKMSGLDRGKVASLMVKLAPVLLGALGRARRNNSNRGQGGLTEMLMRSVLGQQKSRSNPTTDLITKFLDRDGDGSVLDEVASMGMDALGGFFKR